MSSAERLFAAGFDSLIPVIPPGASLAPKSAMDASQLGKSPGRRFDNGLWAGMNWRQVFADAEQVKQWDAWGANVGLKADRYPGVDIDCADEGLALMIEQAALAELGPAPVRIGNPPKRLLPYRTSEPFSRMRLYLKRDEKTYLVEILGAGQQYLVAGIHPKTLRPYSWSQELTDADALTPITREKAAAFLDSLKQMLTPLGYECERRGDGSPESSRAADQTGLMAPSVEELRKAVALIPNDDAFPGWPEFVKMLHAIRAAAGPDEEDGFEIFLEWRGRRNNGEGPSEPGEDPRSLWRRTRGPYSVGWSWIAELARPHGYNDAPFDTEGGEPEPTHEERAASAGAPYLSDQWLALKVVEAARPILRYVPAQGRWLVWDGSRWRPDMGLRAEDTIKQELRVIAKRLDGQGGTAQEQAKSVIEARAICSGGKAGAVRTLVQSDRAIAVELESLDHDKWSLNTPAGMVSLKTGELHAPDPDALCTKATSVRPVLTGRKHPEWTRFLEEATGGDVGMQSYLQRVAGYCLTGSIEEHMFAFFYGPGGNGKGTFLNTVREILGDYGYQASMATFVSSGQDRHPTELAAMCGARMVSASETQAGRRWDDARVKSLTGGDPVTAHFMRQDDFTFNPTFKLLFAGNHKPEIRDLDAAMRRRIHLVPFIITPKAMDKKLDEKLKAEYPDILGWMVEGCLAWQRDGLKPPPSVIEATNDYFDEVDPVGQWLDECTAPAPEEWLEATTLFDSWKEWANRREEYVGKVGRLRQMLMVRKYPVRKHPTNRRSEIGGIKIVNRNDPVESLTR